MFEKMSDSDAMMCFRSMFLLAAEFAKEKGIRVGLRTGSDGKGYLDMGEYTITFFQDERCDYRPEEGEWKTGIDLHSVCFGQAPKKTDSAKANTTTISSNRYEELVRDSEKVRILTQAMQDELLPGELWIRCILGMQQEEEE